MPLAGTGSVTPRVGSRAAESLFSEDILWWSPESVFSRRTCCGLVTNTYASFLLSPALKWEWVIFIWILGLTHSRAQCGKSELLTAAPCQKLAVQTDGTLHRDQEPTAFTQPPSVLSTTCRRLLYLWDTCQILGLWVRITLSYNFGQNKSQ